MTFEEFKATRQYNANLGNTLDNETLIDQHGYVYLGALYIEIVSAKWPDAPARNRGAFQLTVGNSCELHDDLGAMERSLYVFAVSEGFCLGEPVAGLERFTLSDDVLEEALNAACVVVQRHLRVETGDVAGVYFSGNDHEGFDDVMQSYADTERNYAADLSEEA